jgi:hypothetical protein
MNWDIPVLVWSLTAVVLSLVWDRATTVGPVLFAWAGAAAGGVVAFVRHYAPAYDQVGIEYIVPSAAFGAACGLVPGLAVRSAYLRGGSRRKAALEACAAAALFAGLGMVVGWISHRRDDNAVLMASGYSAAFAVVGAGLALVNWRLRGRQRHAAGKNGSGVELR